MEEKKGDSPHLYRRLSGEDETQVNTLTVAECFGKQLFQPLYFFSFIFKLNSCFDMEKENLPHPSTGGRKTATIILTWLDGLKSKLFGNIKWINVVVLLLAHSVELKAPCLWQEPAGLDRPPG